MATVSPHNYSWGNTSPHPTEKPGLMEVPSQHRAEQDSRPFLKGLGTLGPGGAGKCGIGER